MVTDIKRRLRAVIVLLDTYFMPAGGYAHGTGGTEAGRAWNRSSPRVQQRYNQAIRRTAAACGVLLPGTGCSSAEWSAEWLGWMR